MTLSGGSFQKRSAVLHAGGRPHADLTHCGLTFHYLLIFASFKKE
ncbi:MAG: hypothetical protein ACQEXX_21915 [Bacillota bacterium]